MRRTAGVANSLKNMRSIPPSANASWASIIACMFCNIAFHAGQSGSNRVKLPRAKPKAMHPGSKCGMSKCKKRWKRSKTKDRHNMLTYFTHTYTRDCICIKINTRSYLVMIHSQTCLPFSMRFDGLPLVSDRLPMGFHQVSTKFLPSLP